jgi:hypothetical protein
MCEKELLLLLTEITNMVDVTPNDIDLGTKVREYFINKRLKSYLKQETSIYNNENDWGKVSGY